MGAPAVSVAAEMGMTVVLAPEPGQQGAGRRSAAGAPPRWRTR